MANFEDVQRIALALPETEERLSRETLGWWVHKKLFVWERPLRKADLQALGAGTPKGPILGVRVEDLTEKEALLATSGAPYFTTPHFDGYPAVLVPLEEITTPALEELIEEAWLARAPARLAKSYLEARG